MLNILKRLLKTIFQRFKHVLHCVCLLKDVIFCNGDSAYLGAAEQEANATEILSASQVDVFTLLANICLFAYQAGVKVH